EPLRHPGVGQGLFCPTLPSESPTTYLASWLSATNLDYERRNIVLPAVRVGPAEQRVARGLRVVGLAQDAGDLVVVHHLPEAVATQQQAHARPELLREDVGGGTGAGAKAAEDLVAVGVCVAFLIGDHPARDHLLDERVIGGHAAQRLALEDVA